MLNTMKSLLVELRDEPAFPIKVGTFTSEAIYTGLTIRDFLASQMIASFEHKEFYTTEGIASRAYELADAMLKVRSLPSKIEPYKKEE